MYPPEQPYGPVPGGQGPYQQGQPGFPGAPQQSDKMPGTAITVRVLMFIGGVTGLIFGGLLLAVALLAGGDSEFSQGFAEGVQTSGTYVSPGEVAIVMAIMGGIMFLYGFVSTALASFLGRRSPVVLWMTVVFQALAALSLVFGVATGGFLGVLPLLFAVGMIVLMVLPVTRAYYGPRPVNPYSGY
ncbi:hypothetical protein ACWFMI_17675 [Nocardiopsis terrae]